MTGSEPVRGGSSPPLPAMPSWPNGRGTTLRTSSVPVRIRPRVRTPAQHDRFVHPSRKRKDPVRVRTLAPRATHRCAALPCKQRLLGSIPRFVHHARVAQRERPPAQNRCVAGSTPAPGTHADVAQPGQSSRLSSGRSRVRIPSLAHVEGWQRGLSRCPAKADRVTPASVRIRHPPPPRRSSVGQSAELITPRPVVRSHPTRLMPWWRSG
jgi:hypothetical protein